MQRECEAFLYFSENFLIDNNVNPDVKLVTILVELDYQT